jgi:D-Tyr-tRNAtyr deacylase
MEGAELKEATTSKDLLTNGESETTTTIAAIRMIVQRYRYARLLVNETQVVTVGESSDLIFSDRNQSSASSSTAGVLVYISFAKTATEAKVIQAAKTILNLPVLTLGAWGDGEDTKSILQLATEQYSPAPPTNSVSPVSLLVVPQANLTAKVKKLGKSIQYRDQISKNQGEELFQYFVKTLETLIDEHAHTLGPGTGPNKKQTIGPNSTKKPSNMPDPSIPPSLLFHQDATYGSFEEGSDQTFPVTYANGEPLTKSARKKLQKIYNTHVIRHNKYLENQSKHIATEEASPDGGNDDPGPITTVVDTEYNVDPMPEPPSTPSPQLVQLVAGTFGKRQGLEIQSDMGPFCHVVEIT